MRFNSAKLVRYLLAAVVAGALLWPLACADDEPAAVSEWYVYRDADVGGANIRALDATGSDDVWAVGGQGVILYYDGQGWRRVSNGLTTLDLNAVALRSPNEGWAVGQGGVAVRLLGGQWYLTYLPTGRDFWGVAYGADGRAFAVGAAGAVYGWDGSTWSDVSPAGVTADLKGIAYAGENVFWVVGDGGTVLKYQDGGWYPYAVPTEERLNCVAVHEDRVYAGGDRGVILAYDGSAWRVMNTPTTREIKTIAFSPGGRGFAGGNDGTLLGLKDDSWGALTLDFRPNHPDNVNGLMLLSRDDGWGVGDNAVLLRYHRPW